MAASGAYPTSPNEVPCANQPSQPRSAQHSWSSPLPLSRSRLSLTSLRRTCPPPPSCCPLPSPPFSLRARRSREKKDTYLFPAELPSSPALLAHHPPNPPPRSLSPSLLSFFPPSLHRSIPLPSKKPCPLHCPSPFLFQLTNSPTPVPSSHPHHDGPQEKAGGGGAGLAP